MRRFYITITIILLFSNLIVGQNSSLLTIGYNRYFNNYIDFKRTNGLLIGYEFERKVNDNVFVVFGLASNIVKEFYYVNTNPSVKYGSTNFAIDLYFPFGLKTNVYNSHLFLLSGLNLIIDRLITINNIQGFDPETLGYNKTDFGEIMPWRMFGFGYSLGLLYEANKRVGFYGELRTTKNNDYSFSFIELGLKYKITCR